MMEEMRLACQRAIEILERMEERMKQDSQSFSAAIEEINTEIEEILK